MALVAPTYYAPTYQAPTFVAPESYPYYSWPDQSYSRSIHLRGPVSHELDETIRQKRFHQRSIGVQESQVRKAEDQSLFNSKQLEKHFDWYREQELNNYYKPKNNFYTNPWIAPWSFPDGTQCFYCKGAGFRNDIGLPGLPCRGCGNEIYLKPSGLIDPQCTECNGEGVWKETFCIKCGGKGLGSAYLPFKCLNKQCGARARTNWEIELHTSIAHGPLTAPRPPTAAAPSPASVLATAPLNQPFVIPVGKKWYPREFPKDYTYRPERSERRRSKSERRRSVSRLRTQPPIPSFY